MTSKRPGQNSICLENHELINNGKEFFTKLLLIRTKISENEIAVVKITHMDTLQSH